MDYENFERPEQEVVKEKPKLIKNKWFLIGLIVLSVISLIVLFTRGKKEERKIRVIKKTIVKTKTGKKKPKVDEVITEEDEEENEEENEEIKDDEDESGNNPTE